MSSRSYHRRCVERLERLRRRAEFLQNRITLRAEVDLSFDKQERSALLWAVEEIERWDIVTDILASSEADAEKLARISVLLRSRLRPSDADLQRTPQLARQYETQ